MPDHPPSTELLLAPATVIERRIYFIRAQRVMLDADIAELYQVPTKRPNERFPEDFMFRLTSTEAEELNRSQFATTSQKHRGPRLLPYAFTEHRVAMLSDVLNSKRAVEMSILMRASHKDF